MSCIHDFYFEILLSSHSQVAVEKLCERMDFVVLDWNKRAQDLYHRHGAYDQTARGGWHLYRMDGEALKTFGAANSS